MPYFIYLLHSGLTELPSNICSRLVPCVLLVKGQAGSLFMWWGQLFFCSHLAPSTQSQSCSWWMRKGRAELSLRECVPPSHSPWWFDCSTWHTPSSGHSGLVDHGCKHIPLGRVLVPAQTKQAISTVTFPLDLVAAESNCANLWAGKFTKEPRWTAHSCGRPRMDRGTQWPPLLPRVPKPEPRCCPLVLIIVSVIRKRASTGEGREGEETRGR